MKTTHATIITAGLAGVWIAPALALESPEDDAPPPPALEQAQPVEAPAPNPPRFEAPRAPDAKEAEATAFLGVVTSDLPEMLAVHLNLEAGEGIIVQSLMPDGPAAKAGVQVHDVILRVADQPILSPKNLSDVITAREPGESVGLELIQKGKDIKLDVTLGTRPLAAAGGQPQRLDAFDLEQMPKELADRIRGAIEGNLGGLDLRQLGVDDNARLPQQMEEAMRELRNQIQGALIQPNGLDVDKMEMKAGATIRMNDPEGCVEVKSNNGSKEVTIRDQVGKVTWSGPWDTEQDKAAAPDAIRQRIDSLNLDMNFKGAGLRLQMRQPPAPLDGN